MAKTYNQIKESVLGKNYDINKNINKKPATYAQIKSDVLSGKYDFSHIKADLEKKIRFDTFESDLTNTGEMINTVHSGWHSPDEMANTRSSAVNMHGRLQAYNEYQRLFGNDDMPNLKDVTNNYGKAIEGLDNRAEAYGSFRNAADYNYEKLKLTGKINFDTFESDFKNSSTMIVNAQNGWQTPETMKNTRASAVSMHERLTAFNEYQRLFGSGADLSEITDNYGKAIEGLDGLTNYYGMYQDADAYNAEQKILTNLDGMSSSEIKELMNSYDGDGPIFQTPTNKVAKENSLIPDSNSPIHGYDENGNPVYEGDVKALKNQTAIASRDYTLAYTTVSGQNIVLETLYEQKKKQEEHDALYSDITSRPDYEKYRSMGENDKSIASAPFSNEVMNFNEMNDEERNIFNYYVGAEKEGKIKKGTAAGYYDSIADDLKDRSEAKDAEWWASYAKQGFWQGLFASGYSVLANFLAPFEFVGDGVNYLFTGELDDNNFAKQSSAIRGAISESVDWNLGNLDLFDIVYNTGMSGIDSLVGAYMPGKNTGALLLGGSAASHGVNDALDRGLRGSDAFFNGLAAGVFEGVFERASIGNFKALKGVGVSDFKTAAKNTLKSIAVNAEEEVATELANITYDYFVNGDLSQIETSLRAYTNSGMSKAEAINKVAREQAWRVTEAGISGALIGGGFGTISQVSAARHNKSTGKAIRSNDRVGDMFNLAHNMSPTESDAYKIYTEYAKKGVTSDGATNLQLGALHNQAYSDAMAVLDSKYTTEAQKESARNTLRDLTAYTQESKVDAKAFTDEDVAILVEQALENGEDTLSHQLATKYKAKLDSGKKLTSKEITRLVEANDAIFRPEAKSDVEAQLTELGEAGDVTKIADAIIKKQSGEILTTAELNAIKESKYGGYVEKGMTSEEIVSTEEALGNSAKVMSKDEAKLFKELYAGSVDVEDFRDSFILATNYADKDYSQDVMLKNKGVLTEAQVSAIYSATVMAKRKAQADKIAKAHEKMGAKMSYKGFIDESVINYTDKKIEGKVRWKDLKPRQRQAITFVKGIAKATGINLVLTNKGLKEGYNGFYVDSNNTIVLDIDAGIDVAKGKLEDTIIPTASHELTHWMKNKAPELYRKMDELIFKMLEAKDGVSEEERVATEVGRLKAALKKAGMDYSNVTEEQARDEIIARACEDMLSISEEGKKLFESLSESEQKTLWDKVKDIIADLKEWITDLLSSYKSNSYEAQKLREYEDALNEISKMWDAMFAEAVKNNQALELSGEFGHSEAGVNEIIDNDIAVHSLRFNLRLAENHKDSIEQNYSEESALPLKELIARYDKILEIWKRLGGELNSDFLNDWNNKVGKDRVFSIFKAQAGYKYNVELSSMCKKGIPLFEAIDTIVKKEVMKELDSKTLGKAEKEILYDILKENHFEIPCAICYVEQARQREGVIIDAFLNGKIEKTSTGKVTQYKLGWNQTLERVQAEMQKAGFDFTFPSVDRSIATENYTPADVSMDEATQEAFFNALKTVANEEIKRYNKENKKNRKLITKTDAKSITDAFKGKLPLNLAMFKTMFLEPSSRFTIDDDLLYSSMTTQNLASMHNGLYGVFNSQGGVGGYKTKQGTIVYWGDILEKNWTPSKLRSEGGVRNQSNSDFLMFTLLDHAQMYIDFTAKGYYLQAYTKVLSELKLFGKSNGKINASFIPKVVVYKNADGTVDVEKTQKYAGLDENGNPIYDDIEGINHEEAFMLIEDAEYSKSIGGTCIGYSDLHISKLLDEKRIQLIIGFHDKTNDTSKRYKGAVYAKNYNGVNEAAKVDSNGDLKTKHLNFNQFLQKAEGKFKSKETIDYNGKTYFKNDIPKLAADLYLEECKSKGMLPAYSQGGTDFSTHPNYYKLLADYSLYDSEGNYAPHQKVEYNMPNQVPYLDENGNKAYMPTEDYIKGELKKELAVRDAISEKLADKSENGIIPQFIKRANELNANNGKKQFALRDSDYMKAVENGEKKNDIRYSMRVTDEKTLEFLDNQPTLKVYRAMQTIDGKLYPPMAAKIKSADGKKELVYSSEIGVWEEATEHPELIKKGKFELDKANGSSIYAAYNPYIHTSASPLNDQFSSAYKRDNLVTVEGEIPISELTSGYRAEYAKDSVGETKWHSGPVASKLKGDKSRKVYLSRWFKPIRIVPDSEVASIIAKTLEGENVDVPYKVVTPSLREELEKVGVPIQYSLLNEVDSKSPTTQMTERTDEVNELLSKKGKRFNALADKRDSLGKFTEEEFNRYYFAHKFLRGETESDVANKVDSIKRDGFKSSKGGLSPVNIMSANNDNSSVMLRGYRPFKGETVLLIPDHWTHQKDSYVLDGYKPLPYEVVKIEYNSQPYYEAYAKAYNEYFGIEGEDYIVNKYRDYEYDELVKMRSDLIQEMVDDGTIMDSKNKKWDKVNEIGGHIQRYFDADGNRYSLRDTESAHDILGETERLRKENEMLRKDFEALQERLKLEKQVTNGNYFNEKQLGVVAGHLRKISRSNYSKDELIERLKDAYSYIAQKGEYADLDAITFDEFYEKAYDIAVELLNNAKSEVNVKGYEKDVADVLVEYTTAETAQWLATEIYNKYWTISPIETTADKYDKRIKQLNFEHRKAIENLRNSFEERWNKRELELRWNAAKDAHEIRKHRDEKLAMQRQKDKARFDELAKKIREHKDAQIAEAKELGRERLSQYRENAERKTRIQRITQNALTLRDWLVKNDKDKHIHDSLKRPVITLLDALDFSSRSLLDKGVETKKDISLKKAFSAVHKIFDDVSKGEGDLVDALGAEIAGYNITKEMGKLIESVDKIVKTFGDNKFVLNNLSVAELETLDKIVRVIKHTVSKVNNFHSAHLHEGLDSIVIRTEKDIDKRAKVFKDNKDHFDKLQMKTLWNNTIPYYAFKRFGPTAELMFKALQDGQDKIAFLSDKVIKDTAKIYNAKELKKWEKEYFDFEVMQPNGTVRKFSLNVPQIMSLYCVTKQEDGLRHVLGGRGITVVETKEYNAILKNIQLTEADLNNITSKLDGVKRAKEVADSLQKYMCEEGAKLGNEVTMARWGIKQFGIKDYFPIAVSKESISRAEAQMGAQNHKLLQLLNMSFTKTRNPNAVNSIEIGNIFDIFSNHMSDMITYNAMALPVLDMYKWMNYKGVDEFNSEHSVELSIKNTFGVHAWDYLNKFMEDINGTTKNQDRDKLAAKLFKNAKVAKVGASISVVLLQPTSYIRAGAVMDDKYLLHALHHKPKIAHSKKYCGIVKWKSLGYYDTDISRSLNEKIKHSSGFFEKTRNGSLYLAGKADELTLGYLWNACELEIRDKRKDLEVGSKEFFDAVGLRLRDVVYATQVVDSTMTRSNLMRSPSNWDKFFTSYASEPTLSFNLATDVFISAELDKRSGKKVDKKYIRKAITAYTVTNAVTAILQTIISQLRDTDDEEKGEKYYYDMLLQNFAINTSLTGKIPYINRVISISQGFTSNNMAEDWMVKAVKAHDEFVKLVDGKGKPSRFIKYILDSASNATGISGYNLYRDVIAIFDEASIFSPEDIDAFFGY